MFLRVILTAAVFAVGFLAPPACASDRLQVQVSRLFELAEQSTPQARKDLVAHYEAARGTAAGDARLDYAYALALLNQRSYGPAKQVLSSVVEKRRDDLGIYRVKIWLEILTKDDQRALADMQSVSKLFPAGEASAEAEIDFRNTADFLGSMFGFLEGPRAGSVPEQTLARLKQDILTRLGPARSKYFEQGQSAIKQQFEELSEEQQRLTSAAQSDREEAQTRERLKLEHEQKTVAAEETAIQEKSTILEADAGELATIAAQLAGLQAQRRTLDVRAAFLNTEIASKRALADPRRARAGDRTTRMVAQEVENIINNHNLELARINAEANGILSRMVALQARRNAILARQQHEGRKLRDQQISLDKSKKRLVFAQRKAKANVANKSAADRSLSKQATSLTTYEEPPYHSEKSRVLSWFAEAGGDPSGAQ